MTSVHSYLFPKPSVATTLTDALLTTLLIVLRISPGRIIPHLFPRTGKSHHRQCGKQYSPSTHTGEKIY